MKNFKHLMVFPALLGLAVSCAEISENEPVLSEKTTSALQQRFVPGQLLIKMKTVTTKSRISDDILSAVQATIVEEIKTGAMELAYARKGGKSGDLILVDSKLGTMEAIDKLKSMPEVEYAEPNWIYEHFATSNDPYFTNNSLWGMSAGGNQFGSQAASTWAANKLGSSSVYVGIIDEGYMYNHEDLAANAGVNPGEIAGNGVDDDGNGLVDDGTLMEIITPYLMGLVTIMALT